MGGYEPQGDAALSHDATLVNEAFDSVNKRGSPFLVEPNTHQLSGLRVLFPRFDGAVENEAHDFDGCPIGKSAVVWNLNDVTIRGGDCIRLRPDRRVGPHARKDFGQPPVASYHAVVEEDRRNSGVVVHEVFRHQGLKHWRCSEPCPCAQHDKSTGGVSPNPGP